MLAAAAEAERAQHVASASGLRDAFDYAVGKLLEPDLHERFCLYDFGGQNDMRMAELVTLAARGPARIIILTPGFVDC